MDRILVTGGLGFIGSNFIRHAHDKWASSDIVNLDAISYGAVPQNLSDLENKPWYQFMKGDAADKVLVERMMREVEVVVHFAAETHVDRSIADPEGFLHSNVVGTFVLLEAARKTKVRRFVHISTDEIYGSAPTDVTYDEANRLQVSSPYSASKAAAEMFVEAYHRTYGLNTVTLRCTNNFGPRQFPEKFIPKTITSALVGKKVPIYGSGKQIRDWTYVLDFCSAIEIATEKAGSGTIYNVSSGNEVPNLEVARLILQKLGKSMDLIQFVEDRPGHDFRYSIDSTRIREELGWKPERDFREALAETVEWYVRNESWWKPLINDRTLSPAPWKVKW